MARTKPADRVVAHALTWAAAGLVGGYLYFHRQPARSIPADPRSIVSPADGRVIHLERVTGPALSFFKQDVLNVLTPLGLTPPYKMVVIELTMLNVHVQRAPLAGHVLSQQYYPGQHANAVYSADVVHLARENEKLLTVLSTDHGPVGVVQVAGLAARRIVPYVQPGDELRKGQPLGMITFGSQVVLLVPDAAELTVHVGSLVTDGSSVVAMMPAALAAPAATLQIIG